MYKCMIPLVLLEKDISINRYNIKGEEKNDKEKTIRKIQWKMDAT